MMVLVYTSRNSPYLKPNMYGMLLESIQHFVREEYGEEVWKKILEDSGYKNAVFTTHQVYPDMLIPCLAHACSR
ncbi:hypothetical protein JTE90_008239 [Oedothorax gibbosus]|uniref:Heme NO-binding domain-containing protein n=1 Tax=Oedothorax gibbosus TaxID=931172 RepID=A0AAV6UP03_9ARAC|nr:hypothetical protein JTE90_008239 [Oedothorax gibbosus]